MATYQIFKETALPGILQSNSIYLVAPSSSPDHVEMYVTGTSASTVKRIVTQTDVQAMINSTLAGANELFVVDDITARDALNAGPNGMMTTAKFVYVINATGDPTVTTGGATYLWNPTSHLWVKTSEGESMDVVINWNNIIGRPTASSAAIDDAIAKAHTHTNKTQLDEINEDLNGNLTYRGAPVHIAWDNAAW